ncbi:MAG: hypothetical protein KC457_15920 [Myxococcales bacterium]|nr:hypothetical protein [Myxococcales bacterium]
MEELNTFKDQIGGIIDKVDTSLAGISGLFSSLNNENTKRDLQGILANTNEISRQVADGEGLVGALFNDPEYKDDFGRTLKSVRHSAGQLDQTLSTINTQAGPALRNVSRAADNVSDILEDLENPNNQSVLGRALHDPEMGQDAADAIKSAADAVGSARETMNDLQVVVAEVRHSVTAGEGTIGKLLKDPKAYDDLVKLLGNIERVNVVKKLVRFVVEQDEAKELLDRIEGWLRFQAPRTAREGRSYLTVALGCTGGQHRSVALIEALHRRCEAGEALVEKGLLLSVRHRDLERALADTARLV